MEQALRQIILKAMSHYMTDKLEFIGVLSFKLIFEKDGDFDRF